jgi:hypothetical protein
MTLGLVEKIANAVLYEGYILYPYRASAVKNRQRWNFGALYPQAFSLAQGQPTEGVDAWTMQTQCLVSTSREATVDLRVRFLHLLEREVNKLTSVPGEAAYYQRVERLEVDGQLYQSWQEAVERDIRIANVNLKQSLTEPRLTTFAFPASRETEPLSEASGQSVAMIVRRQQAIEGHLEITTARIDEQLFKLTVRILNVTPLDDANVRNRDEALLRSLVSTHTILTVQGGEFVSLLEPPDALGELAAACRNVGTWPVLVGEAGTRDTLLSSPIILYDYPQIAPESAGELFDSTEIDEILTLRIMTLTDDEKREMRSVDARARQILERTESLPAEQLMKLHGAMRGLRSVDENQ